MDELLDVDPFAARADELLLREMCAVTRWHLDGCAPYRRVWPRFVEAQSLADLPFLHVGVFKERGWVTQGEGLRHQRTLRSSGTSGAPSRIALDAQSSALQAKSSAAILGRILGDERRPLLVLDDPSALHVRGEVGARVTAAMSLRPLASDLRFVLERDARAAVDWNAVATVCSASPRVLVYGFTWMLWERWAQGEMPRAARDALAATQVDFVHSGGWKKLEASRVGRERFDGALLATVGPGSRVLDFYGLVEQVGIVYPRCVEGTHHVPRWASAIVRDPWTLAPLVGEPGALQLMNPLPRGAPYHSVLTEDLARLEDGPCACGLGGQRFTLLGRMPDAEVRGCSNV